VTECDRIFYGPSKDLIVISVEIDTWKKWILLNIFIWLVKGCDVMVNEIGSPILGFRVYNPDKKIIDDFTKNQLNFLANAMWFVNGFRTILMAVITITQVDIAFSGIAFFVNNRTCLAIRICVNLANNMYSITLCFILFHFYRPFHLI
jgi:hypothetical protein